MPMIYVDEHDSFKTATIKGPVSKKFKDEITEFDLTYLEYDNTKCIIKYVENTFIEREHLGELTEFSFSVLGNELVGENGESMPYGANPRMPILCTTFEKIFETAIKESDAFVLRNTGLDIFCKEANLNEDDGTIELFFDGGNHGIANGGLTNSVMSYCAFQELTELEDVKVSVRVWASETFNKEELDKAADARNRHRELDLADRLNQLGAFEVMKNNLNSDWRRYVSFSTGDVSAENAMMKAKDLCQLIYGFRMENKEGHPTLMQDPPGGVENTIKPAGRVNDPGKGMNSMKITVGI